jgi:hypothetical protein
MPTADEIQFQEKLQTQFADSLERIRTGADKWRIGLATLLGLITAVSLVKGKDTISGLAHWAQYLVGFLLLLGLIFAAVGGWRAMRASFGNPTLVATPSTPDQLGARSIKDGIKAIRDLAWAKWLTVVSLGAVALAVGLTWYLQEEPKHNPPAYLQVVQAADHQVYCGELLKGDANVVVIRKNDGDIHTYFVAKDLSSLEIVADCPK